jgi:L-alanine-DL-glutamate epimerase-like enolase superfamily enzyme
MIIIKIEAFQLRIPLQPGNRSAASTWGPEGLHAVDSLPVNVTTDQGLEGWSESFGFTGVPVTQRTVDAVIAPLCIGQDSTRIDPLMGAVQDKLAVFGRGGRSRTPCPR